MKVAVIISIVSLSNSDILNSKWQIVTLLLSFIKFLIRAASENFRSACYLINVGACVLQCHGVGRDVFL